MLSTWKLSPNLALNPFFLAALSHYSRGTKTNTELHPAKALQYYLKAQEYLNRCDASEHPLINNFSRQLEQAITFILISLDTHFTAGNASQAAFCIASFPSWNEIPPAAHAYLGKLCFKLAMHRLNEERNVDVAELLLAAKYFTKENEEITMSSISHSWLGN